MIYLENKTLLQDVYIPRQDMLPYTTGSSGTYAEGYSDGFESGYTSGSTDGFDSGYTEGYTSGETHQKGLLSSTAFTENGLYTREDGWNEVEVSVEAPLPVLEEKTVVISADTTTVSPSSGYDGMSAVTVDASEYAQDNYDGGFEDGFEDGYSSGSTDEKAKLSGVTFTANTQVSLDDGGYSAVTVNVAQTGHTDQELEDAYDSGYTSGETHQKSLLVSTAFTENGEYQRENGYSAITVNVPTGQTYNIEQNKPFTATTNGDYTITPSTASTTIDRDYFDSDVDRYYLKATTSGYPSTGLFELFLIEDEFDSSKGSIEVYFDDGVLDYNIDNLTLRANTTVDIYGNTIEIVVRNANSGFGYTMLSDFNYSYDVMSAVSLNVNVDTASTYQSGYTSGHTDGVSEEKSKLSATTFTANTAITISDGGYSAITVNVPQSSGSVISLVDSIYTQSMDWDSTKCIDTKITATTATTMRIGYVGAGIGSDRVIGYAPQDGASDSSDWRYFNGFLDTNTVDLNSSRKQGGSPARESGVEYDITLGNNYLYDNINESYLVAQGVVQSSLTPMSIRVDVGSQKVKFVEIKDNGVTVFNGQAAIDGDGNIGLYNSISMSMVYNSALTMTYEGTPTPIPSADYESGYTDGFNSGYTSGVTDGENNIISTFSSMTVTTNGVYGSSAHPLSSITVNVPTSGGSVISLVDYVHTSVLASQSDYYIDTGIIPTTATTFRVQGMYKGISQGGIVVGYSYNDSKDYRLFWAGAGSSPDVYYDFNNQRLGAYGSLLYDGTLIDATCDNYSLTLNGNVLGTGTTQTTISDPHSIIIDVGSWWVKSLEILDNGAKVFDGQAAIDSDGNIGLYDIVSMSMVYNSGLTMAYEGTPTPIPSQDYQSGYTDGQNSIINTFTAITATTNGVYGSSANPLSSITVNVPQSGGIKYVEYLETDGTQMYADTVNYFVDANDEVIYFDFMPISGSVQSDGFLGFVNHNLFQICTMWDGNNVDGDYQVKYGGTQEAFSGWSGGTRYEVIVDCSGFTRNGERFLFPYVATATTSDQMLTINANGEHNRCARARYYGMKVMSGNTTIVDIKPALDGNNIPCFYDEVTKDYYYFTNGTPIAGPVINPDSDLVAMITRDTGFTYINVPSACTRIGNGAFYDSPITGITIPDTVTYIGFEAFMMCRVKNIYIPDTVTTIEDSAFAYSNLRTIRLSNSLTEINDDMFKQCHYLTGLTIPASVTLLGGEILYGCINLTEINSYSINAPSLNSDAFKNIPQSGTVHYPAGSDYSSWQNNQYLSGWTFVGDL